MNNPLPDESESITDIFVLGRHETGTPELMEPLEHQDYRVTLFTQGPQLIDALSAKKPNLIICDITSFGQEACEYCRQIKADDNFWMIPVMILTRASSLGDLLYVLDSNADNFIALPCESSNLLLLIEGMLQTPVERQTSDQIKTQFKIQHDDRFFVVTADRRKLLEFLVSAFEIMVRYAQDLSSACTELRALSLRLTTLEDTGTEHARLIDMLSARVRKKEQDERALKGDLEETEQALDEKTAEAGQLSLDLEDARALLATAEEHIRMLLAEKEKTALSHLSETSLLAGRVSSLSQEIAQKTMELDAEKQSREAESGRSARLDLAVKESNLQTEELKTSLQRLTLDLEHLSSALSSEKDRAHSAEQETQSALLAKAQSEEELRNRIGEMEDSSRRQNDEILRLTTDLEGETSRSVSAEERLETLRHEMEQSEAAHKAKEESHKQELDDLQARLGTAVATLFSQEREVKILNDELIVAHAEEKKTAAAVASVTALFHEARTAIEEREGKIQSLEKQITDASTREETYDEKARALTALLERVQSALNTEKDEHAGLKERFNAMILERDQTLQSVRGAHEQTRTDLDMHKNDLVRLNRDLEAAALLRSTLQEDITAASSRIKELEHELKSAAAENEQTCQQARALAAENEGITAALKEARSALAGEKEQRAAAEAQLNTLILDRDQTLQSVRGAHEQTRTDLDMHKNEVVRLNHALEAATRLNSTLLADIATASSRINELNGKLDSVVEGEEQAVRQARSLSDDLERTHTELEAERKIRRTAEEDLQRSVQAGSSINEEIARVTAERDQVKSALAQERLLHTAVVEEARAAADAREQIEHECIMAKEERARYDELHEAMIRRLNQDLEQVLGRERDLEEIVKALGSQKAAAEARVDVLSVEIQQARTALAEEWEHHMNDAERLAESEIKAIQREQSPSGTGNAASGEEHRWAVVVREPWLPEVIRSTSQELVVTAPPAAQEGLRLDPCQEVSGIEDPVRDDHYGTGAADRISEVPELHDTESATQLHGLNMDEDPAKEYDPADERGTEQGPDEHEDGTEDTTHTFNDVATSPSSYGISFNRRQWFDLLKWSHHSGALSPEQRMQIVRMGRLIQHGRRLTKKQDEQVREMIVLVQTLGYRFT